jgi:hypothetical protein
MRIIMVITKARWRIVCKVDNAGCAYSCFEARDRLKYCWICRWFIPQVCNRGQLQVGLCDAVRCCVCYAVNLFSSEVSVVIFLLSRIHVWDENCLDPSQFRTVTPDVVASKRHVQIIRLFPEVLCTQIVSPFFLWLFSFFERLRNGIACIWGMLVSLGFKVLHHW